MTWFAWAWLWLILATGYHPPIEGVGIPNACVVGIHGKYLIIDTCPPDPLPVSPHTPDGAR